MAKSKTDGLYRFIGAGRGVPGLPHEITEREAKDAGVWDLLQEAVKAGNFEEVKPEKPAKKEGE